MKLYYNLAGSLISLYSIAVTQMWARVYRRMSSNNICHSLHSWYGFGPVCGMLTGSVTLFLYLLVLQVQRDSGWSLTGSAPPKGAMTLSQLWMVSTGLSPCGQVGRGVELAFVETISTLLLHSHVRLHERTISDLTAKYSRFYLFSPVLSVR